MPKSTPSPSLEPIAVAQSRLHPQHVNGRRGPYARAARGMLSLVWGLVPWALGGVAFFVAGAGASVGWQQLARSPMLQIRRIDITGEHRTTRQEILAYAGVALQQPILGLQLDVMALRLRQHPWIARASIRRQLPDRLHIQIVEHEPMLLVSLGDLYLADAQGQLFKRFEGQDRVNLPVVTGIDRDSAAQHVEQGTTRLRLALQLAQAVAQQRDALGRLEEIHWDEDLGWNIVLQAPTGQGGGQAASLSHDAEGLHPAVRAQLGYAPLKHLTRVASALQVLADRGQAPDVIWADGDRTPNRVPVELLAERAPNLPTGHVRRP